eukprot:GILJ01012173.1.p1 GENE.GILJ01012173.1~~GILJ01012173.1.p1  ORF type:complete len:119 (+),score=2.98 GILJ01012173.1:47-403(+)
MELEFDGRLDIFRGTIMVFDNGRRTSLDAALSVLHDGPRWRSFCGSSCDGEVEGEAIFFRNMERGGDGGGGRESSANAFHNLYTAHTAPAAKATFASVSKKSSPLLEDDAYVERGVTA